MRLRDTLSKRAAIDSALQNMTGNGGRMRGLGVEGVGLFKLKIFGLRPLHEATVRSRKFMMCEAPRW